MEVGSGRKARGKGRGLRTVFKPIKRGTTMNRESMRRYRQILFIAWRGLRSASLFLVDELRRGTLPRNLLSILKARGLSIEADMSHAELLEERAARLGGRVFLAFKEQAFTYSDMDQNANRVANFLRSMGAVPGDGLAIIMKNSPRWLDVFFAVEKLGMYAVPVNIALRGDQLAYVIGNSDARFVVIDHDLLPHYLAVEGGLKKIAKVIVNAQGASPEFVPPKYMADLDEAYGSGSDASKPPVRYHPDDMIIIMFTSGTTGLPKGVVYRYRNSTVKSISIMSRFFLNLDDVYYTCYPLFHANALFLTVTACLHAGCRVALGERFSASRFWDELRRHRATIFNGLGAVMPILMKQPPRPDDSDNKVHSVLSSGCPADMWEAFERRFGVRIYEAYGAVDGAGVVLINLGTGPVGSMGKPLGSKCRIVDSEGRDVPVGEAGELIGYMGNRSSTVEYYKNAGATSDKVRDGWLYTGDLVYKDRKGYIYFLGRNTELIRCKGENVSAYEVEQAILKHPDVLECAVYAVPSELAEDDIMVTLVPMEGKTIDPQSLPELLSDKLAKFAIPRYYRVVDALPKTETHRVIKRELQSQGVTEDTFDAARQGGRP
jgi:crotonobetaine/carnitine-CoA ligase